ncbi:MAG: hypothetical protein ACK53L_16945 [Pirellulaceae bacterium]
MRELNLAGTQIDDEGIVQLAALPALTSVSIANSGVSYEGIDKLKEAKPDLEVIE